MKKKKVPVVSHSSLFELFAGEYVRFVLDIEIDQPMQIGENLALLNIPFTVDGYLFEEDDDFYFLSYDSKSEHINHAVRKDFIVHVEAMNPEDVKPEEVKAPTDAKIKPSSPKTSYN